VGLRAGLDAVVKRKIPNLCLNSNFRSSSPEPSAIPLGYPSSTTITRIIMKSLCLTKHLAVKNFRMVN
jgi:hypothetical protein